MHYKDDPVVGGSKPVSTVLGLEVPEYTEQYRYLKLNKRDHKTSDFNTPLKSPSNFFIIYRESIEHLLNEKVRSTKKNCQRKPKLIMLYS